MVKILVFICFVIFFHTQMLYGAPSHSEQVLKRFDKDHDNRISFAEAPNRMQENFHRHDLNRDGYISGTELEKLPKGPPPRRRPPPPNETRPSGHPPRR